MPTLVISAFFILFEVIVYAGLIAVMPRSGGDYVWQSRILGGGIGFVLAVTGWWFILWLWVPLYGDMLRHIVFTPLLGILGAQDAALWFCQTPAGLFVTASLIMLAVGHRLHRHWDEVVCPHPEDLLLGRHGWACWS